jgi:hypothetical protein
LGQQEEFFLDKAASIGCEKMKLSRRLTPMTQIKTE